MANARALAGVDRSYFFWRGALGILVGIFVLVWPQLTVLTLVTLVSLWLLLVGVISIIEGVMSVRRSMSHALISLVVGFIELGVGAYLVQRPHLTTLTIVTLIGLVFIVQGLALAFRAFFEPLVTGGRRMLSLVFALLSVVAGVWIWRYPLHGTLAFVWLLGLYAIASGSLLIAMGFEAE